MHGEAVRFQQKRGRVQPPVDVVHLGRQASGGPFRVLCSGDAVRATVQQGTLGAPSVRLPACTLVSCRTDDSRCSVYHKSPLHPLTSSTAWRTSPHAPSKPRSTSISAPSTSTCGMSAGQTQNEQVVGWQRAGGHARKARLSPNCSHRQGCSAARAPHQPRLEERMHPCSLPQAGPVNRGPLPSPLP